MKIGDYRILDYGMHQYKSFTVYKIIDKQNHSYTIKSIIRSKNLDPYADYSFDIETIDVNYSYIANSIPINFKLVFDNIFNGNYEWELK